MSRHQAICELLGITDDDEFDDEDMMDQYMSNLADEWLDDEEDLEK